MQGSGESGMAVHYINFYFKNILYDEDYYFGDFSAPGYDIYCSFEYDRKTKKSLIWNSSKPAAEILPLPIWWLDLKLEKQGFLDSNESKISY